MKSLKPADIILVNSGTNYGKAILSVLNLFQKDGADFGHVLLVVDGERAIAVESRIRYRDNIDEYLSSVRSYKIIRNSKITDDQRLSIVKRAEALLDIKYGVFRVVLQLFDQIFVTNFFTRWLKDKSIQVCSTLVSWSYYVTVDLEFNDVYWACVDPDDIDDESLANPDWEIVASSIGLWRN